MCTQGCGRIYLHDLHGVFEAGAPCQGNGTVELAGHVSQEAQCGQGSAGNSIRSHVERLYPDLLPDKPIRLAAKEQIRVVVDALTSLMRPQGLRHPARPAKGSVDSEKDGGAIPDQLGSNIYRCPL